MRPHASKRRWALAVLLVPTATLAVFIVLVGISSHGLDGKEGNPGSIVLSDVDLRIEQGQLYLDAEADVRLPATIQKGIDSGVSLDFILRLRFVEPHKYWFDNTLAQFEQRFSLSYYELTRHYRVQIVDTDSSRNYRSLTSALRGLGSIERLPVMPESSSVSLVDDQLRFEGLAANVKGELDFRLDVKSLPFPLQPLLTSSWQLASKEYSWLIN